MSNKSVVRLALSVCFLRYLSNKGKVCAQCCKAGPLAKVLPNELTPVTRCCKIQSSVLFSLTNGYMGDTAPCTGCEVGTTTLLSITLCCSIQSSFDIFLPFTCWSKTKAVTNYFDARFSKVFGMVHTCYLCFVSNCTCIRTWHCIKHWPQEIMQWRCYIWRVVEKLK